MESDWRDANTTNEQSWLADEEVTQTKANRSRAVAANPLIYTLSLCKGSGPSSGRLSSSRCRTEGRGPWDSQQLGVRLMSDGPLPQSQNQC